MPVRPIILVRYRTDLSPVFLSSKAHEPHERTKSARHSDGNVNATYARRRCSIRGASVGTNDTTLYIFVADRANARVTTPNDTLHPAVLNEIDMIIRNAHDQSTPVSVCGEMASDPAGALMLLGMGVDALSMSPANFGLVKLVICAFTSKQAWVLADQALELEDEGQVRSLLNDALEDAGI